ncbi:coiled-coil domain-containing protein 14-like [Centropristis striata]|uniref:coiled-coil domain-containing protein 14-like n=1 Tax=Centropristis striata TaxID=184440 RepID=UPI0027DF3547|nr:coiled-coil domain-containing protein 14-like [Centropristis striata]
MSFTMKGSAKSKVVTSGRLTGGRVARTRGTPNPVPAAPPEPAYSLYSTDSEDQVTSLHQGLDRCAALLSDMLRTEKAEEASAGRPRVAKSRPATLLGKKPMKRFPTKTDQKSRQTVQRGAGSTTFKTDPVKLHPTRKQPPTLLQSRLPPTTPKPQPQTSILPPQPQTSILPPQPQTSILPPQPQTSILPPQPQTSILPPQTSILLAQPQTSILPLQTSILPAQPQTSILPAQPQTSILPPQPQTSILPPQTSILPSQTSILPTQPQTSILPPQTSILPTQPQTSILTLHPQTSILPPQPQTSILPTQPQTSILPTQPQTSILLPQPQTSILPLHPQSSILPPQPQTSILPTQPQTSILPTQPQTSILPTHPQTSILPPQTSMSAPHPSTSTPPPQPPPPSGQLPLPQTVFQAHSEAPHTHCDREEEEFIPVRDTHTHSPVHTCTLKLSHTQLEPGQPEDTHVGGDGSSETEVRVKTAQCLLGELKALMAGQGSVAERLLSHLEQSLPLMNVGGSNIQTEPVLLRENTQLRRRVRILNQQLKEREKAERHQNTETLCNSAVSSLQEELTEAQSRLQELQDDLTELRRAFEDTQSQLTDREAENAAMKTELEAARSSLLDSEREKSELVSLSKQRLEEIEHLNRILQNQDSSVIDTEPTKQHLGPAEPCTHRITQFLMSLEPPEPAEREENTLERKTSVTLSQNSHFNLSHGSCGRRLSRCESVSSDWSARSGSTFDTRDEAAFRDGLAALDASIASLQRSIQLDLGR